MSDIGDLKVETSPWEQPQIPTAASTMFETKRATRTIHYVHPICAPMAPPTAKACKSQVLYKFGSVGLCLETCTVVEDVPMTDCFVVDDRLWVYENSTEEENNATSKKEGCIAMVTFQIRFVKSTMFRRIIENTTREEFNKWWGRFGDMIATLESPAMKIPIKEEVKEVKLLIEEHKGEGEAVSVSNFEGAIHTSCGVSEELARRKRKSKTKSSEQEAAIAALDMIDILRSQMLEYAKTFVPFCLMLFLMITFNIVAMRQMIMLKKFLSSLDAHLEKLSQINEAILSKLEVEGVAMCSP